MKIVAKCVCVVFAVMVVLAPAASAAGPVVRNEAYVAGEWIQFGWDDQGPLPIDSYDNPYEFTCDGPCVLRVTDMQVCGDYFEVRDNGTLIGTTSAPSCGGSSSTSDADVAWNDPHFSHGTFALDAGAHSIDFRLVGGVESGGWYYGEGYFRFDEAAVAAPADVPLASPGSLAVMAALLGLAGLLVVNRIQA